MASQSIENIISLSDLFNFNFLLSNVFDQITQFKIKIYPLQTDSQSYVILNKKWE